MQKLTLEEFIGILTIERRKATFMFGKMITTKKEMIKIMK